MALRYIIFYLEHDLADMGCCLHQLVGHPGISSSVIGIATMSQLEIFSPYSCCR